MSLPASISPPYELGPKITEVDQATYPSKLLEPLEKSLLRYAILDGISEAASVERHQDG